MPSIQRILVPVDFSPASKAAIDYASFLGERFEASIDVLHVWEQPRYIGPEVLVYTPGDVQQTLAQFAEQKARREMSEFLDALDRCPAARRGRLETGDPIEAILRVAEEGFDLIVMGTHGRGTLDHLLHGNLLGRVSERVVRRAPCPVLTVHAPRD